VDSGYEDCRMNKARIREARASWRALHSCSCSRGFIWWDFAAYGSGLGMKSRGVSGTAVNITLRFLGSLEGCEVEADLVEERLTRSV